MSSTPSSSSGLEGSSDSEPPKPDPVARLVKLRHFAAQPVVAAFLAGGVAGAVSRTVVSPLERLKILFQIQPTGKSGYNLSVPKALAKMWRDEGFKGLMKGNGTNCVRIIPYSAVQFSSYNLYKPVREFNPQIEGHADRGTYNSTSKKHLERSSRLCADLSAELLLASPRSPLRTRSISSGLDFPSSLLSSQM